jgi:hydroxymethylglutaryl-CoA synthase
VYARSAGLEPDAVVREMHSSPDILDLVRNGDIDVDVYPLSIELVKNFRTSESFRALVEEKMSLGAEPMKDIGNVYCAALPAWLAAGLEEAAHRGLDLAEKPVLAVGYGSGDAAEAIPMRLTRTWKEAAARIGFTAALQPQQNLTREQYEHLHDNGQASGLIAPDTGFIIESVGSSAQPGINDEGIEYYRFLN